LLRGGHIGPPTPLRNRKVSGFTFPHPLATCRLDPEISDLDALSEATVAEVVRRTWRSVAGRTLLASTTDRVSLAAAGCAFYATLALFPAISMLISLYGMVLDPVTAEQQLVVLSGLLPAPAYGLIEDRIHQLISQPANTLSASLLVSFLLTFWSSSTGSKSVLSAINVAYDVTEQRPFLRFQFIGLSMTLVAVLCASLAIAVLLLLPPAINFLGLSRYGGALIHVAGMAMLIGFFFIAICLLYRFGPSRPLPPHRRIKPGAALATILWLIASELLSLYISRIGSFGATYGSLGAVVGIMLWFYISAYAVLLGAELNARLEEPDADKADPGD
jgi:membrane protein